MTTAYSYYPLLYSQLILNSQHSKFDKTVIDAEEIQDSVHVNIKFSQIKKRHIATDAFGNKFY